MRRTGPERVEAPRLGRQRAVIDPLSAVPSLDDRRAGILACRLCLERPQGAALPHEPRPILQVSRQARLVIASQAPGIRAHESGVPFRDPSGVRLRAWMGVADEVFYDPTKIAIVPMGFCFPGHDAHRGDLPPRPECRLAWHDALFAELPHVETVLGVGLHAIRYHAARLRPDPVLPSSLTDVVAGWRELFDREGVRLLPLPHPSWRNSGWLKRNPWFETDVLPVLRDEVRRLT